MFDQLNAPADLSPGKTRYLTHKGLFGPGASLGGWRKENLLYALEIDDYDVNE
jgi:hypothetical protein